MRVGGLGEICGCFEMGSSLYRCSFLPLGGKMGWHGLLTGPGRAGAWQGLFVSWFVYFVLLFCFVWETMVHFLVRL